MTKALLKVGESSTDRFVDSAPEPETLSEAAKRNSQTLKGRPEGGFSLREVLPSGFEYRIETQPDGSVLLMSKSSTPGTGTNDGGPMTPHEVNQRNRAHYGQPATKPALL